MYQRILVAVENSPADQTILNLEQGYHDQGCTMGTLARICACLGTTVFALMAAAEES